jgi:hypothetical protein
VQGLMNSHQRSETQVLEGASSVSFVRTSSRGSDVWPAPAALPDPLRPVEPFEPQLLPHAFRPWIEDIAERMQCPQTSLL